MEANKLWLIREFIGQTKVLFRIPVYQRNYDWSEKNCLRLWDDIERILQTGKKHFIGSIVFMKSREANFVLPQYTIIDGQQRLTTIMISLKALADLAKENDDRCKEEIENSLLHNQYCDEEFKIKLKPINSDNEQFIALLNNDFDKLKQEGHIYRNYIICKKRMEILVNSGYTASKILEAMQNLEIVYIELQEGEDDPQVIFESINSTGLDLTNADLIRNFLLMTAPDQKDLYESYWLHIEKKLKPGTDYDNLNQFFKQYIVYKTNTPCKSDQLYERFVNFYTEGGYTRQSILKELKYYADIFHAFVYNNDEYGSQNSKILKSFRYLKQKTCYPFLFHIFDDYKKNLINDETLRKTLKLIQIYLVKRSVCGVPSHSLRGLFIYLYNRIFKVKSNKNKYYESINKFLHTVESKDIMPSDSDFKRNLLEANIYSNRTLCNFMLMDIENGDSKETLDADNLTIEHIMPQRLGVEWRHIPTDKHEQYLHVLGNLSVTGYNSELSNKSFAEKCSILRANSKAAILNSDVLNQESWNIENIVSRGERLAEIVMQRFSVDKITDPGIEFEYLSEVKLTNDTDVTGCKLVRFNFDGEVYRQNKFVLMLQDILKLLDKRHPGKIEELSRIVKPTLPHSLISNTTDNMRKPLEIKPGIFVELNLSATSIVHFINSIFDNYKEDKNIFSFSIVADEQAEEEEDFEESDE